MTPCKIVPTNRTLLISESVLIRGSTPCVHAVESPQKLILANRVELVNERTLSLLLTSALAPVAVLVSHPTLAPLQTLRGFYCSGPHTELSLLPVSSSALRAMELVLCLAHVSASHRVLAHRKAPRSQYDCGRGLFSAFFSKIRP